VGLQVGPGFEHPRERTSILRSRMQRRKNDFKQRRFLPTNLRECFLGQLSYIVFHSLQLFGRFSILLRRARERLVESFLLFAYNRFKNAIRAFFSSSLRPFSPPVNLSVPK